MNSTDFNLWYDKKFRRELPYYVLYEIPRIANGSTICSSGNSYYFLSKKELQKNDIQNRNFIKFKNNCIIFKNDYHYLYIIGYSISSEDDLQIQLDKNLKLNLIILFEITIKFILIFLILILCFKIRLRDYTLIYLLSLFSTIIICLLKDPNLITGLRYFRGGADGLTYYSLGRDILNNLQLGEYYYALQGGTDIFYFMPGQRYFVAISNMIFGASSYGYILISSVLPISIYIFFKRYIGYSYAIILFILFVFFPIFENLGFGFFNYVHQVYRNHGETLSILCILLSLIYIINLENDNYQKNIILLTFSVGLILSIAAIVRPNFVLTTNLLILYCMYILYTKKNYINIFLITFGYSTVFLCALHNFYFGGKLVLFTSAFVSMNFPIDLHTYKEGLYNILIFNFENMELQNVLKHLNRWNPIYNFHRVLILLFIIYSMIKYRQTYFNYLIFFCILSQHSLLFFTNPDSRYSYLAWLLTFVLFVKLLEQSKVLLKLSHLFKKHDNK